MMCIVLTDHEQLHVAVRMHKGLLQVAVLLVWNNIYIWVTMIIKYRHYPCQQLKAILFICVSTTGLLLHPTGGLCIHHYFRISV